MYTNFEVFNFIKQMLNEQKLTDCHSAIVDGFNTHLHLEISLTNQKSAKKLQI